MKNIKFAVCILLVVMCIFSGCNKKAKESVNPDETPVVSGNAPVDGTPQNSTTAEDKIDTIPEVTIDNAVSEDVKQNIDFDAYENQDAYELNEVETSTPTKTKLIYPINTFKTDTMDVKYHVALVNKDTGSVVLEVLGTDFNITKNAAIIKVEWKSVGLKVMPTEKVYEFKGLCITIDEDVYFYQDLFYSPFIEGREITYKPVAN